jgi:hypothetical protein
MNKIKFTYNLLRAIITVVEAERVTFIPLAVLIAAELIVGYYSTIVNVSSSAYAFAFYYRLLSIQILIKDKMAFFGYTSRANACQMHSFETIMSDIYDTKYLSFPY